MISGIGISGPQRSGKDSLAAALMKDPKFSRVSFANELKSLASNLTNIDMFNEANKIKHRQFLILLGQAMRAYDINYWVNEANEAIEAARVMDKIPVITDLRFVNEARALKDMGFLLIRLECSEAELLKRGWDPKYKNDPSEAELNNYDGFNVHLHSDAWSPEDLAHQVKLILEKQHGISSTPTT